MIKENRRLWKLILYTIPTFGIYSIVFWFQFTKDLNDMNNEEKPLKNYILVLFLSIITFGIYRWVWFFYLADRIQTTGQDMGMKIRNQSHLSFPSSCRQIPASGRSRSDSRSHSRNHGVPGRLRSG